MRRFFTLLGAATAATLWVVGCGSDSPSSPAASAGSTGSAGSAAVTQCVGNNAEFTSSTFAAQTTAGKACANASDNATVCANDLPTLGATCGKGCLGMGMGNDALEAECVAGCINDGLSGSTDIATDCMACYTTDVECARKNCLVTCGLNPTGAGCAACRVEKGCVAAFYECSGLPVPGGSTENAGAGGT